MEPQYRGKAPDRDEAPVPACSAYNEGRLGPLSSKFVSYKMFDSDSFDNRDCILIKIEHGWKTSPL